MKLIYFLLPLYIVTRVSLTAYCQDNQVIQENQAMQENKSNHDSRGIVASKNLAVVQTEYGKVRGYIRNGIYTFKGIPYGKANRFMPPEKPSSWDGIRSSMTYGPTCPSVESDVFRDELEFPLNRSHGYYVRENCLNLNIWSKKINDIGEHPNDAAGNPNNAGKAPVMVYLHGGGFATGSSVEFPSLDGENLSRKGDVVVVTINHRLNVLGFLDLSGYGEKYSHSTNAGLRDIIAALTWIKENISNFGGDPDNITIFGQSGGAGKVTTLMFTPAAKGLFHKAIVQSGGYYDHFTESGISKRVTSTLLDELGLRPDQIDSLQTLPYAQLGAAAEVAMEKVKQTLKPEEIFNFGFEWGPFLDSDLLPYQPADPAVARLSDNVPLLVGSCKNEYMPFIYGTKEITMDSVKAKLQREYGDKTTAYLSAVRKAYPETVAPVDFIDIDFLFRPGVIKQADQKSKYGAASVYVYLFTWQSPVLDGAYKAFHTMDIPFVFNNISRCEEMTGGGQKAYQLADKMSEAWTQFARTGNPNCKELPAWPDYNFINGATMIFDNKCQVKYHPDKELQSIAAGH